MRPRSKNGLLVAAFSFAQFLAAPFWGKMSDRVGRKPVLFVSIVGTAVGFLLMGFAGSLAMLFVARIIDGAAGGNIGTAQATSRISRRRKNAPRRWDSLAPRSDWGLFFGPAIGARDEQVFRHPLAFLLAAAMAVANAILIATILPESLPKERRGSQPRASIFEVFRHSNGPRVCHGHRDVFFA